MRALVPPLDQLADDRVEHRDRLQRRRRRAVGGMLVGLGRDVRVRRDVVRQVVGHRRVAQRSPAQVRKASDNPSRWQRRQAPAPRIRSSAISAARVSSTLLVLHYVAEEPCYGNQLMERICALTAGAVAVNPNTMYPLLHSLETRGLIAGALGGPRPPDPTLLPDHAGRRGRAAAGSPSAGAQPRCDRDDDRPDPARAAGPLMRTVERDEVSRLRRTRPRMLGRHEPMARVGGRARADRRGRGRLAASWGHGRTGSPVRPVAARPRARGGLRAAGRAELEVQDDSIRVARA